MSDAVVQTFSGFHRINVHPVQAIPGTHQTIKVGKVVTEKKPKKSRSMAPGVDTTKVKFEIYGEEMIEKIVKLSGNSGRIYLPPNWVGRHVKIIRID